MGIENNPIRDVTNLMKSYPKQFDIIGSFECEYHMTTNLHIPPVQHAMRKTSIEYQEKIEQELDKMIQGIITPITEPTEWVNSITYPMKPSGELHICLDPRDLNTAIVGEQYKAPMLEEITHKLSGAKRFFKLDA